MFISWHEIFVFQPADGPAKRRAGHFLNCFADFDAHPAGLKPWPGHFFICFADFDAQPAGLKPWAGHFFNCFADFDAHPATATKKGSKMPDILLPFSFIILLLSIIDLPLSMQRR